ncbi:MAG: hypothetical protein KBT58_02455 [Bizionia sp.]|nr:hypothetical protein [Bizionia sp.]
MKKVTLFLMTLKGYSVLESIIQQNFSSLISKVIYSDDKSILNDYSKEIIGLCKANNIDFYSRSETHEIETEYSIAISWRWLIKTSSNQKLIVLHDSLLPKYRGFSPLVTALINGDKEIGVSALFATEEYDKGDIIKQSKIAISYPIKIEEAIIKITGCYIELTLFLFINIQSGSNIKGSPQNEVQASYSLWRDEADYEIDWNWTSSHIKRFVDAVNFPYKGASSVIENKTIRILEVEEIEDLNISNRLAGKVIRVDSGKPVIVCGKGLIKIVKGKFDNSDDDILPFKKFRTRLGL